MNAQELLDRPNGDMSPAEFHWQLTNEIHWHGVVFVWVVRDSFGRPVELYPLNRNDVTPLPQQASQEYPFGMCRVRGALVDSRDVLMVREAEVACCPLDVVRKRLEGMKP